MPISEIFPNPTVKQVVFQIRYPSLFLIENRIGDFQIEIMQAFPQSSLVFTRQVVFVDVGPGGQFESIQRDLQPTEGQKIWQFKSNDGKVQLNVSVNSLDISSESHKTYNLGAGERFRETIRFAVDAFLKIAAIPTFTRIGLRYLDHCPVPGMHNDIFASFYNSAFPLHRFDLSQSLLMHFRTTMKRGNRNLSYVESLALDRPDNPLILDFDGFAENVPTKEYLAVTDELHDIILGEFERTIKEPVYAHMRQVRGS